jgi:AraC-like DNA-binding protein
MSDRLSILLQRFELHARVFHAGPLCGIADFDGADGVGHLHLVRRGPIGIVDGHGRRSVVDEPTALFYPRAAVHRLEATDHEGADLLCASIEFGVGDENPLVRGLPTLLSVPLASVPGLDLTQQLLFGEGLAKRCGHAAVVDRLTEVLVVQLLRHAIEHRLVDGGVLAGLGDARLAKALNAIHAAPARAWSVADMAAVAGMSRARFAAHFRATVGTAPADYLTGWRLGLARSLLRNGSAVKQVAEEVGYRSASALARVFNRRLGATPATWSDRRAVASRACAV